MQKKIIILNHKNLIFSWGIPADNDHRVKFYVYVDMQYSVCYCPILCAAEPSLLLAVLVWWPSLFVMI